MDNLTKAKVQIILKSPFFACLMLKRQFIEDSTIKTACTNGQVIKYNPAFFKSLSVAEIMGTIVHEVLHITNLHHVRRGTRELELWNKACVTGDSLILMADGTEKAISDIKAGEAIMGWVDGKLKPSLVLDTLSKVSNLVEVRLHNGYKLKCTPDHEILTTNGYKQAQDCKNEAAQVVGKGKEFYKEECVYHDYSSISKTSKSVLQANGQLSVQLRSLLTEGNNEKNLPERDGVAEENRLCLHSRDNRWGRNNKFSLYKEGVLSPTHNNKHDLYRTGSLFSKVKLLWSVPKKLFKEIVLESINEWFPSLHIIEKDFTIPDNKKAARYSPYSIHTTEVGAKKQSVADERNEIYSPKDSRIKCSGFTVIRQLETQSEVFDLTTTTHSYIANGIIVHNCDYAINPMIKDSGYTLPKGVLSDKRFFNMPTENIFAILNQEKKKSDDDNQGDDGSGAGNKSEKPDPNGIGGVEDFPATDESQLARAEAEAKVELAEALLIAKQSGSIPAGLQRLVEEILEGKTNWKEVLCRFVTEQCKSDYSWARPNRRYMAGGFIMPSLYSVEIGIIVMVVDTSGSIDKKLLNKFAGEIQDIASTFNKQLTVMYCDTKVSSVQEIEADDEVKLNPKGGGGTDFIPPFEWLDKEGDTPACLIYFTDGCCDSFPPEPDYPTLWAVYGGHKFKPPFGETINIDE